MCQLLGMNSRLPVSLHRSLEGFVRRGGDTDHHADGWGIAYLEDGRFRRSVEEGPAAASPLARSLTRRPFRSTNVIVHLRKATQGPVAERNCHPFLRHLWGREWVFAHNGHLKDLPPVAPDAPFRPEGETDSEHAFCTLLSGLAETFGPLAPRLPELRRALARITARLASHGSFNYLLSDGEHLFAHCSTQLHWLRREAPFGTARLVDCPRHIDFSRVNHADDRITVVATRPVTADEAWTRFLPGELKVFGLGTEVHRSQPGRATLQAAV
jgi:predicted glutamine amidotransferase